MSTLIFSGLALLPKKFREHLSGIAIGSALSVLTTIGSKGDIQNLSQSAGIENTIVLISLFIIPALVVSLLGVKRIVDLEGEE
ncbi:MAG: hypothetical protein H8Z69_03540 [Nanohaloarchaea archaeon]|nr:hypothetical protein [Candidatus Nanohaloarchaea archaeon]